MVIDLSRFVKEKLVIAPVVDGWGKVEGRKLEFPNIENGWYQVKIGNTAKVEKPATPLEIYKTLQSKKHYFVFAYGEDGIPINFDNFKKLGLGETVRVNFFNLPLFSVGKVVLMEDGRFYFFEMESRLHRPVLESLRQSLRPRELQKKVPSRKVANGSGLWAGLKGLTPELAYYSILISLTSQAFREVEALDKLVLSPEEKEKRVKQFANTIEGRLRKLIKDAGGKFIDYKQSRGNSLLVTWEVGGQQVKSQISGQTFQIVSAGYCLSGDDKRHTMSSIVRLAKDFQEESPLYITRE